MEEKWVGSGTRWRKADGEEAGVETLGRGDGDKVCLVRDSLEVAAGENESGGEWKA